MSTWTAQQPPRPAARDWKQAMGRGFRGKCPECAEGKLFASFLKATPACCSCGTDFTVHRADDMPPYVTIMIVGHIVVPLILFVERAYEWPIMWHSIAWPLLTIILTLLIMQPVKGALIAYQWALRMHGFDPAGDIHEVRQTARPAPDKTGGA